MMVYNADERDTFERLTSIHAEFADTNQVGAYQVLVSVISPDIIARRAYKEVKKAEA